MIRDLRFSLRLLASKPALTVTMIATLALAIGANTAIFSVVYGILLKPLPYAAPERLTMVWMDNRRLGLKEDLTSWPNFEDWGKNQVFDNMAGFSNGSYTLEGGDEPERLVAAEVTANFFDVLGVRPAMGRTFTAEEEKPNTGRAAIISDGLWRRRFGADPKILGQILRLEGRPVPIVGIMPPGFSFPRRQMAVWLPLAVSNQARQARGGYWLSVVGRLKNGVPLEQARAEMNAIGVRLEKDYPNINTGYGVYVVPLLDQLVGRLRVAMYVLLGAVGFVLLIACANVGNLLLARANAREREMAVRAALGAGRWRLIRQLLSESLLLSAIAGAAGVVLGIWGVDALLSAAPRDLARVNEIEINGPVLWFSAGVSLLAALLFGLVPALKIGRSDLNEPLKEGGRSATGGVRGRRAQAALVVAEVALAVVLLAGAGLMIRSFARLQGVDPGYRAERVLTMRLAVSQTKYPQGPQVAQFYSQLIERLRATSGVEDVGAISDIFLSITPNSGSFTVEGKPVVPLEQQIEATRDAVTPEYFQTLRVPLIRGRYFTWHDGPDATPVVIINETMARGFWPDEDPIGKRFKFGGPNSRAPWLTIAGVVGDMRRQGLDRGSRAETFLPVTLQPRRGMDLVIRTAGDPMALAATIQSVIRSVDKDSPLFDITTLEARIGESISQRRFQTVLLGLFSVLALVLAAIGIYGVMYQFVSQRTHEFGVRVALGAQRRDVIGMVLRQAMVMAGSGVLLGILGALVLTRAMSTMLFGVSPADLLTFTVVPLLLGAVALAASYIPARRSTRIDPLVALRYE